MRTPLQDWIAQEHGRRHYFNREAAMVRLSLTEDAFDQERCWLLEHQWMAEYYPGFYTIAELWGSTRPFGPVMPQDLRWVDGPDALFTNPIQDISVVVRLQTWRHPSGGAAH